MKQMIRHAYDNTYLHKDFHQALNFALIYLEKQQGEKGVRAYLTDFAEAYYAPLNQAVKDQGLSALQAYMKKIYALEGGEVAIRRTTDPDQLDIIVSRCPAVTHIRAGNNDVSPLFHLTHEVVNDCICRGTPWQSELLDYNPQTGSCIQRFSRRTTS